MSNYSVNNIENAQRQQTPEQIKDTDELDLS